MKKTFAFALVIMFAVGGWRYTTAYADFPSLKDGDIIFQTTVDKQSGAIAMATASLYTHMGVLKVAGPDIQVVEAVGPVRETPLKDWVRRGLFRRVAIYRDANLTPAQATLILAETTRLYGRKYDVFFSFKNDEIYCSELVYLGYKAAGISLGKIEKVSDLNADNKLVKGLIERRWRLDPECTERDYNFEQCYRYILDRELITPASIARDTKLTKIYSNYPF